MDKRLVRLYIVLALASFLFGLKATQHPYISLFGIVVCWVAAIGYARRILRSKKE